MLCVLPTHWSDSIRNGVASWKHYVPVPPPVTTATMPSTRNRVDTSIVKLEIPEISASGTDNRGRWGLFFVLVSLRYCHPLPSFIRRNVTYGGSVIGDRHYMQNERGT